VRRWGRAVGLFDWAIKRGRTWWGAFLAPAPDPRQKVADAVTRQRALLRRVREARHELAVAVRQLECRVVSMLDLLAKLEDRARDGLLADREDVARVMLERRWVVAQETRALEAQARELGRQGEQLALVEERLAARITAFDAHQQALAARTSAADAQARIAESLAGLSMELGDLGPALEEAERRAEESHARAAAIERLLEEGSLEVFGPAGESTFGWGTAGLDRTRAVDEQISRLRREAREGGASWHS